MHDALRINADIIIRLKRVTLSHTLSFRGRRNRWHRNVCFVSDRMRTAFSILTWIQIT